MLVVQKFGGTSVGSVERIQHVADRVVNDHRSGKTLVVVVSAMGGETDRLLTLAEQVSKRPEPRELDQLLGTGEQVSAALLTMALQQRKVPAVSLTGSQMRIETDGRFNKARIVSIDRRALDDHLHGERVVVATGFQGVNEKGELTTLGRGGSDTSAVAIAAALGADECEIYTDVDGVYSADPRVCSDAVKLKDIAFDEMMEMASAGSKVLQIRSVELAMNHGMPIRVRSTFSDDPGTLVHGDTIEKVVVRGVSHSVNDAKVTIRGVPDQVGIAARIFSTLARHGINVDVIVQNLSRDGATDVSFSVPETDLQQTQEQLAEVLTRVEGEYVEYDRDIGKVAIVGVGMRSHPGVAAEMFEALAEAGINIEAICTSEIKVTCLVRQDRVADAVNALHRKFNLQG